jgi:AcrR family transcriptional regulator
MPRRRNAVALTEDRLLEAALQIVDDAGMEALSMRRLGAQLGVDPMAIYYYLPNKQALVRRLVERVFSGLRPADREGLWQARVMGWATAYRDLALAHPNLVFQIFTNAEAVSIAVAIANESLHAAVRDSGVREDEVAPTADTLVDYVHGFVLAEAAIREPRASFAESFRFSIERIVGGIERRSGTA